MSIEAQNGAPAPGGVEVIPVNLNMVRSAAELNGHAQGEYSVLERGVDGVYVASAAEQNGTTTDARADRTGVGFGTALEVMSQTAEQNGATPEAGAEQVATSEKVGKLGSFATKWEKAVEAERPVDSYFARGSERLAAARKRFSDRFAPIRRTVGDATKAGKAGAKYVYKVKLPEAVGAVDAAAEATVDSAKATGRAIRNQWRAGVRQATEVIPARVASRVESGKAGAQSVLADAAHQREVISGSFVDKSTRKVNVHRGRQNTYRQNVQLFTDAEKAASSNGNYVKALTNRGMARLNTALAEHSANKADKHDAKLSRRLDTHSGRTGKAAYRAQRVKTHHDSSVKRRADFGLRQTRAQSARAASSHVTR